MRAGPSSPFHSQLPAPAFSGQLASAARRPAAQPSNLGPPTLRPHCLPHCHLRDWILHTHPTGCLLLLLQRSFSRAATSSSPVTHPQQPFSSTALGLCPSLQHPNHGLVAADRSTPALAIYALVCPVPSLHQVGHAAASRRLHRCWVTGGPDPDCNTTSSAKPALDTHHPSPAYQGVVAPSLLSWTSLTRSPRGAMPSGLLDTSRSSFPCASCLARRVAFDADC